MYIFISDKTVVGKEIVTTLVQTFKTSDEKMNKKLIERIGMTIHDLYTFSDEERETIKSFIEINKQRISSGRIERYIGHMYFDLFSVDYCDDLPNLIGEDNE